MFGRKGKTHEQPLEVESAKAVEAAKVSQKPQKYELLPAEQVKAGAGPLWALHRIRALVDIPLHDVKAGDLGGYVANEYILSHEGSCWIGGDAIALYEREYDYHYDYDDDDYYRDPTVKDNALVTGNALVTKIVSGDVKISGNAIVDISIGNKSDISGDCKILSGWVQGSIIARGNVKLVNTRISNNSSYPVMFDGNISIDIEDKDLTFIRIEEGDKIEIKGKVNLSNVSIKGSCAIDAEVNLESVTFKGKNTILGKPQIKPKVTFTGHNFISGDSLIPPGSHVHDVRMTGGVLSYGVPTGTVMPVQALEASETHELETVGFSESAAEAQEYVDLINQIEADYEAYTTDIVKLIKYPAMVDASVPEVMDFMSKLRAAKRGLVSSNTSRLKELAESLDASFIRAENRVRTLVASHLDEGKKKSLKTAEQMFKLACDESSPEPEKKLGFKAGMRSLEGIVDVSDKAVENMKVRIGILELEA